MTIKDIQNWEKRFVLKIGIGLKERGSGNRVKGGA